MLGEWYGPAYAARESAVHGLPVRPAADFLDAVTRSVFSEETSLQMRLESSWQEIVGDELAAMSRVGKLEDGVLTLEVRHSVYRKELANAAELIRAQVNCYLKSDRCREIRLEAANRRNRKFSEKKLSTPS